MSRRELHRTKGSRGSGVVYDCSESWCVPSFLLRRKSKWLFVNILPCLSILMTGTVPITRFLFCCTALHIKLNIYMFIRNVRISVPELITTCVANYEGGSICNENPFITPSTNALGFYAICQTKVQSVAAIMVYQTLFYLSKFNKYRLLKKHTNIHCIYFPPNCKDST